METIIYKAFQIIFLPLKKLLIIDYMTPHPPKILSMFKWTNSPDFCLQELEISQPPYDDYFMNNMRELKIVIINIKNSLIYVSRFIASFPFNLSWYGI